MSLRSFVVAGVLLVASPFAVSPLMAAPTSAALDYRKIEGVASSLAAGRFAELHSHFDPTMAGAVSAEQLSTLWSQIIAQAGPYSKATVISESVARLHFEKANLRLLLAVNPAGKITGLRLVPDEAAPQVAPVPALTAADPMIESAVTFRAPSGPEIVGTLTLPKGVRNPPAVVLVHGSGAHDRYETIFGNRPFLDLARGLAKQGIAVLAYDKRTLTHAKSIDVSKLTLDQETTSDASAAAKFLQSNTSVDPKNIFVLGHSQGGMIIPRVLQRDARIRGGIIFASPSGKLIDVLPHQNRTMLGDAVSTDAGKAQLKMIDDGIATIRNPKADPVAVVFGQPLSYWKSVDAVNPLVDAKSVKQPMLIVQGGKDFQVIEQDWSGWPRLAQSSPKSVTWKLYPALNHLGVPSLGKPGMEDYKDPRHVDPQLISDIAAWVKRHR